MLDTAELLRDGWQPHADACSAQAGLRVGPKCYVAAVGDSNDPTTWSGIPYHFLQAGRAAGLFDAGLNLSAGGLCWQTQRLFWNGLQISRGDRRGGYQYSVPFLEWLWRHERKKIRHSVVVNCFQLYPPSIVADPTIKKWFFIDQTLRQLFDHYGQRSAVGQRIAAEAMVREQAGYQSAAGIIVHSQWAASSVIDDYGIDEKQVHVIVPGANLDPATYHRWERQHQRTNAEAKVNGPLRLVFVGKDWQRKGLDRLLRALTIARGRGSDVTLCVIGCMRESLPREFVHLSGIEWCGFVDKKIHGTKFLDLVGNCDIGCLLSTAEAGGIALREFHALGLAVLGTTAGGAPEHSDPECAWLLSPSASIDVIGAKLCDLASRPEVMERAKAVAWRKRHDFLYGATINKLRPLFKKDNRSTLNDRPKHD